MISTKQNKNNYKLYQLVFNNIVLKNHIFGFVKNKYHHVIPKPYNDLTLAILSRLPNKMEILDDKIKTKTVFKDINKHLIQLLLTYANKNYPNEESVQQNIIKFYQINKQQIYHELVQPQWTGDLITVLIESKCNFQLLNLVYSDYLEVRDGEIKDEKLAQAIIDIGDTNKLSNLYRIALKNGSLDSLKFIHKTLNTSIKIIEEEQILEWVYSPKRDELLEYLLDEMDYQISIDHKETQAKRKNSFYLNSKYLSFPLFKRIFEKYDDESKRKHFSQITLFNQGVKYSKSSKSNEIIDGHYLPFRKVLDLIQCTIYISSYLLSRYSSTILNFKYYLEKIELLIKYNNDPTEANKQQLVQLQNNQFINENGYYYYYFNSLSELVSKLFSLTSKRSTTTTTSNTTTSNGLTNFKKTRINFNQFNLEREVRRIYTFDYLLNDIRKPEIYNMISNFVVDFATSYKEYQGIEELTLFQFHGLKEDTLTTLCFYRAFENADSQLINFIFKTFKSAEKYKTPILGVMGSVEHIKLNCNAIPMQVQIEFLSTILSYDIYYPFSFKTTLAYIFSNNKNSNLTIENLDKITTIIEQYQFKITNEKVYSDRIILFNLYAKHCFVDGNSHTVVNYYQNICKKSNLFKDWDEYYKIQIK